MEDDGDHDDRDDDDDDNDDYDGRDNSSDENSQWRWVCSAILTMESECRDN